MKEIYSHRNPNVHMKERVDRPIVILSMPEPSHRCGKNGALFIFLFHLSVQLMREQEANCFGSDFV
jgi:hypothetical protein